MQILKRVFDFYLQSSIHVALSVFALVRMTQHQFGIPFDKPMAFFAFFGTIVGYNFVKYDALARIRKSAPGFRIKLIAVFSGLCFLALAYCFFNLELKTQLISGGFLLLTMLYTLPFFPNTKNARNWAGIKIYIVSFCWVGVTLFLPLVNAFPEMTAVFTADFFLKCIQRFILVFVLILIFEIIDLEKDDPHLHTVPQQIGVSRTKFLAVFLLVPFYFLELLKSNTDLNQLYINLILLVILSGFVYFASTKRSRYYAAFWAESVPILWWLLLVFFR
jgi:hypothetical protein